MADVVADAQAIYEKLMHGDEGTLTINEEFRLFGILTLDIPEYARREAALQEALGAAEVRVKELKAQIAQSAKGADVRARDEADRQLIAWLIPTEREELTVDFERIVTSATVMSKDSTVSFVKDLALRWLDRLAATRDAVALPSSSVVPVEAGTGTESAEERRAPAEGQA